MNFWDKVQNEIQNSTSRLARGRKNRRDSSDSPLDSSAGSPVSGKKITSPLKKKPMAGNMVMDDDMGLADEILASPVRDARPKTSQRGVSAASGRSGADSGPIAPPRARRTGGWADDAPPPSARRRGSTISVMEEERFKEGEELLRRDSDDEGPAIPDLDDVQAEDFSNQVALAPSVAVNRVATFKELDSDLFRHGAFATLDDIDLRALVKCMAPEPETKELDTEWTWDALFTEVTSEILKDQYVAVGEDEDDQKNTERLSSAYIG